MPGWRCPKCSPLPVDIWRQIATYLPASTLSTLQQVSKLHHTAIISEEIFRERYLSQHNRISPPKNLYNSVSWSKLYRHSRALRYPPSAEFIQGFESARIIGAVGENVVLYDESRNIVRGYPARWERNVDNLCVPNANVLEMCFEMPNFRMAFIESKSPKQGGDGTVVMRCIDVRSGLVVHTIRIGLFGSELSSAFTQDALHMPKVALLAGEGGHMMYFTMDGALHVVDVGDGRTIQIRRDIPVAFGRLVRTECVETGGFVISGIVVSGEEEGKYMIHELVKDEKVFELLLSRCETLVDVVRSVDGETFGNRIVQYGRKVVIEVHTRGEGEGREMERNRVVFCTDVFSSSGRASGEFSVVGKMPNVQLRMVPAGANGRAAAGGLVSDGRVVRIRMGETMTIEKLREQRVSNAPFDWGWMDGDGMLIVAGRVSGIFSVFDVGAGRCVGSYRCGRIKDVVMAGHFLVATVEGGLVVWHFDKYCRDDGQLSGCHKLVE